LFDVTLIMSLSRTLPLYINALRLPYLILLEGMAYLSAGLAVQRNMTTANEPFISVSDITYVDFRAKRVLANQVLPFEKMELVRED
jgi:hypothetical protein